MKLALSMLAGLLALVTLAVLAARLWWPFDLLSHFRLQYVIVALVLLVVALAVGARPAAAVLAVVVIVHGWAVRDLWLPPTASPLSGGVPVSIISINVLSANQRPEAVGAFIHDRRPDIAVLVDAQGERWRETLARLAAVFPHAAPDHWREATSPVVILSRFPIRFDRLAPQVADRPPFLLTTMDIAGREVTVTGVHPTSPDAFNGAESRARNRQLDMLADALGRSDAPAIVAGDFNTSLWSPHARDLLRATGLRAAAAGFGWHATWPHRPRYVRVPIDHVLVRGPIGVRGFRRGPAVGSDHLPILADLVVRREDG